MPADGRVVYNWPAFWVLRDNGDADTCEIDIAEVWEGVMQNAYHCSGIHAEKKYTGYRDGQFHIWTMRRTSTTMYFYVDGTLTYTLAKAAGDNGTPQYCILNVGRTSSGNNNVYGAGSRMLVDYVRAWEPAP